MKSIGVVTTSGADYGIYRPLLRAIRDEVRFDLQLIVSGMHLVDRFGSTIQDIDEDGFPIQARVHSLMASDAPAAIAHSIGNGVSGFATAFEHWTPDLLIVLGDRFEMYAAAIAALPFRIPIVHLHGGELTLGAIDEAIRHSITKLSHVHFVSTETYRHRVLQLGEEAWRVHNSGALGLDAIRERRIVSDMEFKSRFGFELPAEFLLCTYHPVTLEASARSHEASALFLALEDSGLPVVFSGPNADPGGQMIAELIDDYVEQHPGSQVVPHFGSEAYLEAMSRATAMVGNSSSGILEAAAFSLPVINVGDRQAGRIRGKNVLDVPLDHHAIRDAVARALNPEFRARMESVTNPYGDGRAAERIVSVLSELPSREELIRKTFIDVIEHE